MSSHKNNLDLSSELIDKVMNKLDLSNRPSLDLAGLSEIYRAWCRRVPFDNMLKLIHVREASSKPLPGAEPQEFFESWLELGCGGTCWSGNGALYALLKTLGFDAHRGLATMLVDPKLAPNHGTVIVNIDNYSYLVDASILHDRPLCLGTEEQDSDKSDYLPYALVRISNGKHHIWWRPLHMPDGLDCRIESHGLSLDQFKQKYEETRIWSPFNYELHIRMLFDLDVVGVARGRYVNFTAGGESKSTSLSECERAELLCSRFGISPMLIEQLPSDISTPPPPWSNTRRKSDESKK